MVQDGCLLHKRRTIPDTCGVAIEVPDFTVYLLLYSVDITLTPGAEISTWLLYCENDAISSLTSVAPTDMTDGYDAG